MRHPARIARHRAIGIIDVSLATAMTLFGFLVAVEAMKRSAALGQTDAGIAFAIVPLSGILFFAVVFTLAVAATRRPETHKRLMLLAGISILDAAVARWFLTFLAPPGPAGPPPVPVTIRRPLSPISCYSGRHRVRLAHPQPAAPGLPRWRRRADRGEAFELADQRHAVLAFLRRRHIGDGAIATGPAFRQNRLLRSARFSRQEDPPAFVLD